MTLNYNMKSSDIKKLTIDEFIKAIPRGCNINMLMGNIGPDELVVIAATGDMAEEIILFVKSQTKSSVEIDLQK